MPHITLPIHVLDFEPPLVGFEGEFNTFRLGLLWSKRVKKGTHVLLVNTKDKIVFGRAQVLWTETGELVTLAYAYAKINHNQLGKDRVEAFDDLMSRMRKRYGPHIARDDRNCTVIYLRRKE